MNQRLQLRYGVLRWLLVLLGMGPRLSWVEVGADVVAVRMGWAFSADIPRHTVTQAVRGADRYWGIGVHGWRGQWLVNGSVRGIVTLRVDPRCPARTLGFPIRLQTLHVSLAEPEALLAALGR